MKAEIQALEKHGTWCEVDKTDAKSNVTPGLWVFRRKRTPDGQVKKHKARYTCRGDLQEEERDTYAPVVAWSTVRLFFILALVWGWKTLTIDFSNAFVQSDMPSPV